MEEKIKIKIHYHNGDVKDNFVIEGKTIKECRKKMHEQLNKRNWEGANCWSEVISTNLDVMIKLEKSIDIGNVQEKWNKNIGDFEYSLTEKGIKNSEDLLKKSRSARFTLFEIIKTENNFENFEAMMVCATLLKKKLNINFFQDIIKGFKTGEISGIKIKTKDEKEILSLYDTI